MLPPGAGSVFRLAPRSYSERTHSSQRSADAPQYAGEWLGDDTMRMRSVVRLIAFFLLTMEVQASAGDHIYRFMYDAVTVHFTSEFYSIPEKYRSQVVPPAPEPSPPVE